jgi:transcriptional regulator with XRE-family HTH domain
MSDKSPAPLHPAMARVVSKFGTQTAVARAIGVKPHTLNGKARGDTPLTYPQMKRLLEVAPEVGVELRPDDFFPQLDGAA